jgi:nicotinate phosphoribosyltransferase
MTQDGKRMEFVERVLHYRNELSIGDGSEGELAAFIAYAQAFPKGFLALVDTYDTLQSGVPNFLAVALALTEAGFDPVGIRLDSGDLSHLSKGARQMFHDAGKRFGADFDGLTIVASNEINEPTLRSLAQQGHEIDVFGVGTNLVTCQAQPALGCVYKLVEINGEPRLKISQESMKSTIPGRKPAYRLIGQANQPLADLLVMHDEDPPKPGQKVLCSHPFEETKRTYVLPSEVIPLHHRVWDGAQSVPSPTLDESRNRVRAQLDRMREDHLRLLNPTPYKVSLSERLLNFTRELWRKEAPIGELR